MNDSECPNKELCGSCGWSHIPYEKQLAQKLSDINGSFRLKELNIECREIIPSPRIARYRNRMDFVIDFEGKVGLREKGKWWRVIDNHPCFLGDQPIESLFSEIRNWVRNAGLTYFDRKKHHGFLRYAVVRCTAKGESLVALVTSALSSPEEEQLVNEQLAKLADLGSIDSLIWSINHTVSDISVGDELRVLKGVGYLTEEIAGFKYKISPHSFFQTNSYCAPLLLNSVKQSCAESSSSKLLDLYCGSGFFSIALANQFSETLGVELVEEAINDAKHNAELNGVDVRYENAKSEDSPWEEYGADLIIVDPPRSGMHDKALAKLLKCRPDEIIYVSCNYKNLARECVEILKSYAVESIEAIDMFPHTPHVEVVAKFKKI